MSDRDLEEVRKAWRSSSDADVARALANPDWYPPCVFTLIQEEAQHRGLEPDTCLPPIAQEDFALLRRFASGVFRLLNAHPLIAIALIAAGIQAATFFLPSAGSRAAGIARGVVFVAVYILGMIGCCWPLRKYRVVLLTTLTGNACFALVSLFVFLYAIKDTYRPFPPPVAPLLLGGCMTFVMMSVVTTAPLSVVVFLLNRYRPIHLPGHCVECGYNLRGLSSLRCPECGTPFDAEQTDEPNQPCGAHTQPSPSSGSYGSSGNH